MTTSTDYVFIKVIGADMPRDFEKCVDEGGRVRTITIKGGKYMRVCYDKEGKSHAGETHTKKK